MLQIVNMLRKLNLESNKCIPKIYFIFVPNVKFKKMTNFGDKEERVGSLTGQFLFIYTEVAVRRCSSK